MESPYRCADSVRESCNSHAKICGETVYTHFDVYASENGRSSLSKRSKARSLKARLILNLPADRKESGMKARKLALRANHIATRIVSSSFQRHMRGDPV